MNRENITLVFKLKSQYWEGNREFEINTSVTEIDFENLEEELVRCSADFGHICQLHEWARYELEKAENDFDFFTSTLYQEMRSSNFKATETFLKHMLAAHPGYNEIKGAISELRHKERSLHVLVKTMEKKSNKLSSLNAKRNAEVKSI